MQTLSSPYEDVYLLCEKIVNEAITSQKQIHVRSFYNLYIALHKFNRWFDSFIENDFEKLFKDTYYADNLSIEKWEHNHYWNSFLISSNGSKKTERLLLKLRKLRYVSSTDDRVLDRYFKSKIPCWPMQRTSTNREFDEVSMILRRNSSVIRENVVVEEAIEYDLAKNRIQFSEGSKIILKNMIALEHRMSSYLSEHACIEDFIFNLA